MSVIERSSVVAACATERGSIIANKPRLNPAAMLRFIFSGVEIVIGVRKLENNK
jgi:hypothetical protein